MAELSVDELAQALAALDRIGDELAQMSSWLLQAEDHDRPGILLQDAYTALSTAGWELSRPMREALQYRRARATEAAKRA